jgi:hypothetical protein
MLTTDAGNLEKFCTQGYFAGFLIKPINTDQLISKVFELIVPVNE